MPTDRRPAIAALALAHHEKRIDRKILTFTSGLAAAFLAAGTAAAQTATAADGANTAAAFDGFTIGAPVDNRHHEVKRAVPGLTDRVDDRSGGIGYRGFVGYDKTFGGIGVVGVEAGIGKGGKDVTQAVAGGAYRMNPGWAWDASARLGVRPTPNLLLYGRVGYGWTRAKEAVDYTAAGQFAFARKFTDGGLMYGFGAEFAAARGFAIRTEFDQTNFGKGFKSARLQLGGVAHF